MQLSKSNTTYFKYKYPILLKLLIIAPFVLCRTGRILREQVAEVCLAALSLESAKNKVCDIVASSEKTIEGKTSMATFDELFASL